MTDRWQELQTEIGEFTDSVFGQSAVLPKLCHLQEEIVELKENPDDLMEWADCVILLLDAARKAGVDTNTLYDAVQKKMTINRTRDWGTPDENGVVRHVK